MNCPYCSAALPPGTSIVCPACRMLLAPNPAHRETALHSRRRTSRRRLLIAAGAGLGFVAIVYLLVHAIGHPSVGPYVVQVTVFVGLVAGAARAFGLNLGLPLTIKYIDSDIYSVHGVPGNLESGLSLILFSLSALLAGFFL